MLYQGPFSTRFYRKLHSVVHHEFRGRKARQALQRRFSLRQAARFCYHAIALPAARWQLNRLASQPNPALTVPHLNPEQAAHPTPQEPG